MTPTEQAAYKAMQDAVAANLAYIEVLVKAADILLPTVNNDTKKAFRRAVALFDHHFKVMGPN